MRAGTTPIALVSKKGASSAISGARNHAGGPLGQGRCATALPRSPRPTDGDAVIEATGLTRRYDGASAVSDVSFRVERGELLALVGGSGSGKTTTLKMINRLVEPDAGSVFVDGKDAAAVEPHALRRSIGYVFQGTGLFPHMTVAENVAVPLRLLGWPRERAAERVAEVLALVELGAAHAARYPAALSGGEQQRAGVARALAAAPRVMLLDEPFAALDPLTRDRLQQSFLSLRARLGLTAVFVTHDVAEAVVLADRVGVMRGGRLVQVDTPAAIARRPGRRGRRAPLRHAPPPGADGRGAARPRARPPARGRRMSEVLARLPELLAAHVRLTLASLAAGVLLAVPLGVVATRVRVLEAPVLAVAGVIQTVPALALLAGMVPLLSALGLPGIGPLPAFLALVLYSLLPILRNTVAGIRGLDPAVIEAARGLGMTRGQQLRQVELPLALPVIVAGVRTATVWTVGMATLSTPVGAASLGDFIFAGLQTRNTTLILAGCAAAAVLALSLDGLVRLAAHSLAERRRGLLLTAVACAAALAAWAFGSLVPPRASTAAARRPVVVGAKTFTEQYVLAEVLAGLVRERTGRDARTLTSLGSTVAFDALRRDEIDLYVDYTGTLWATVMGRTGVGGTRADLTRAVSRWLRDEAGVTLVASLGFENAYCFAVRRQTAESLRLRTLSDLARHAGSLSLASDYEFFSREEWRAVERAYGLKFRERRAMDPSLLYQAISSGQVDVITAYSTDGRIDALSLSVLEDDARRHPALRRRRPRLAAARPRVTGRPRGGRRPRGVDRRHPHARPQPPRR